MTNPEPKIKIIEEQCNGCGICVDTCLYDAITIKNNKACINQKCIFCMICITTCPLNAIAVDIGI